MAEEPKVESQPGTTDDPPAQKPEGPDEAEVARLTTLAGKMEELQGIATAAGFGTVDDYLETLEATAWEKVNEKPAEKPEVKSEATPTAKPEVTPEVQPNPEMQTVQRMLAQTILGQHYQEFRDNQGELDEASRSQFSKDDLTRFAVKHPQAIESLAPQYKGNLIEAANALMSASPDAIKKAREAGEAAATVKAAAAGSSVLPGSGKVPEPDSKSKDELAQEQNDERRHDIAPKEEYVQPQ